MPGNKQKLNLEQKKEIWRNDEGLGAKHLGIKFGVCSETVRKIRKDECYRT